MSAFSLGAPPEIPYGPAPNTYLGIISMYADLIAQPKLRAVFNLVRKHPGIRFAQLASRGRLHDPEVAQALRTLKKMDLVWPVSIPTKGDRVFFAYELSPKGMEAAAFVDRIADAAVAGPFKQDAQARAFAKQLEATTA